MTHHDPRSGNLGAGSAPGARPTDGSLNAPQPVIHDAAPVRSGSQARQAPPGRPVLYVLIGGIVLALRSPGWRWGFIQARRRSPLRQAQSRASRGRPGRRTPGASRCRRRPVRPKAAHRADRRRRTLRGAVGPRRRRPQATARASQGAASRSLSRRCRRRSRA